ncbi:YlaF family protein [Lederbergia sp. NSJ-179]|uniref:YlaF family protein n=1 Tax=Lederbergia sp. NSJ-179 TaxID=2931402 RepID=UPI001FD2CC60|nr:YlaF family protein [Lederbergia sp. NSJ-179]MCJ7843273.1 YlaF family protein [Lederbergia sp. NSJ-179]
MREIKWNFLILAVIATFSIMGIGICLAEQSVIGMILCFVILCVVMMYGFKAKKKMLREEKTD